MKFKLIASLLLIIIALCGCSGKKKTSYLSGKDFVSLIEDSYKAKPDSDTVDIKVTLKPAKRIDSWLNSDFNLVKAPENILISNFDPNKNKTFSIYRNDNIFGSDYTPVIDKDIAYVVDNKNVIHAFDLNTKKNKWSQSLINKYKTDEFAGGGIAKKDDILIATLGSNSVVALDAKNGNIIWNYKLSNISRSTPVISGDYVYVITIDNKIYSFNIFTGIPKWALGGAVEKLGIFGSASPAIYGNNLVVPHSSGQLITLKKDSGEVLWDLSLINTNQSTTSLYLNDIDMTPVIDQDVIYICNYSGTFFAININTGSIKWLNDTVGGGSYIWNSEEFIFTINKYSQLVAVYKLDGSIKWVLDLEQKISNKSDEKNSFSGPILVNGELFISSSSGQLFAINPNSGKITKTYQIPKNIYSPPIVSGNRMILFNNQGTITIIE